MKDIFLQREMGVSPTCPFPLPCGGAALDSGNPLAGRTNWDKEALLVVPGGRWGSFHPGPADGRLYSGGLSGDTGPFAETGQGLHLVLHWETLLSLTDFHSPTKCLLSTYYMPDLELGAGCWTLGKHQVSCI